MKLLDHETPAFEGSDFSQEPKKVFVNKLIYNLRLIEWNLYVTGSLGSATRVLRGTINSLDMKSQKKLDKISKELAKNEESYGSCDRKDLERIHRELSSYLHDTYLKEAFFAKPKFKGGKIEADL